MYFIIQRKKTTYFIPRWVLGKPGSLANSFTILYGYSTTFFLDAFILAFPKENFTIDHAKLYAAIGIISSCSNTCVSAHYYNNNIIITVLHTI